MDDAATARATARRRGSRHDMPFGACLGPRGATFRLWAPAQSRVALCLEDEPGPRPMHGDGTGWHTLTCAGVGAGARYRFVLEDGTAVPDPASRHQPDDVHGPSELIDPLAYAWRDGHWRGRPWHEAVLYELHVGCFTPEGTFRAAIDRLGHLATLGVTALELMPVADFAGRRGWGYDGVLPFAPESTYGRPEDLKALVDAAHARGLMVLLDVVYNHFGPEGHYAHRYWPQLVTDRHRTPWGPAVNYDDVGSAPVREFVIQNALYWLEEFHFDGLRLDAVHAIRDDGPRHLLDELAARARALKPGHAPPHLLLENEENEARRLAPDGAYTAQWNDDVHHGLHVALTGEASGYYAEYRETPSRLPRALAEGFAFQGETMRYRGRPRGSPSAHLPPTAFVAFLQNHDQVGNRARGERIATLAPPAALRAATAICLLSPQVPMLFMGEEWGSRRPFLYFCDFREPLASAVRDGRRAEFARFPEFADAAASLPDPTTTASFEASKLDWPAPDDDAARRRTDWTRAVLATRRARITPLLGPAPVPPPSQAPAEARGSAPAPGPRRPAAWDGGSQGACFRVRWWLQDRQLTLLANLEGAPATDAAVRDWLAEAEPDEVLWREGWSDGRHGLVPGLPAWSVSWTIR